MEIEIVSVAFLDWWKSLSIKAQRDWLERHVDDSNRKELMSLKEVKAAIRKAKVVKIQPRYGLSEAWIEISKKVALEFVVNGIGPDESPEEAEMYGGVFGSLDEGVLYLG
jgi:hypothetical protein